MDRQVVVDYRTVDVWQYSDRRVGAAIGGRGRRIRRIRRIRLSAAASNEEQAAEQYNAAMSDAHWAPLVVVLPKPEEK
jgi:hypothetical protein